MGGGASAEENKCQYQVRLEMTVRGCILQYRLLLPSFLYNMSVKYFVIEGILIKTDREQSGTLLSSLILGTCEAQTQENQVHSRESEQSRKTFE